MSPSSNDRGYWMVASDGGIFSFGDASFRGSLGGNSMSVPIVGMSPNYAAGGYYVVNANGQVWKF
jgi:hypothetical protein